jgi:CheY-like chemotaxis protein
MDAYVSKPVSPAELYRAIDELLNGPVATGSQRPAGSTDR